MPAFDREHLGFLVLPSQQALESEDSAYTPADKELFTMTRPSDAYTALLYDLARSEAVRHCHAKLYGDRAAFIANGAVNFGRHAVAIYCLHHPEVIPDEAYRDANYFPDYIGEVSAHP